MTEPQAGIGAPLPGHGATPPAAPQPALDPAHAVFNPQAEPSDDAPTIISRPPTRPVRPDDAFAVTLSGRRLAHFDLIEPIGVGGMAAVIRARDTQLDRTVALKILPPEMAVDPEVVRRFQQEARAAAKLDHENIARVFFCGEDQGLHFIAFEYVQGDNLRTILDRRGRLRVPEAVNYMLQVATGLAHAAERGVVHRDIKPSNIIISPNGRAKLVDMGLARSLDRQGENGLTHSGVTLGTFDYLSPEQALEPREADVRSDIYSLGCTFYHALTGQAPVPEGTAAKKLHHHQHVAPVDPRQLNGEIPDELAAILARMMAKDVKERYQRAEHLVQHLLQLAQKLGGVADVPEGVLFVDAALPSPPRKRPLLVGAAAVVILVGLIVLHEVASSPMVPSSAPVAVKPEPTPTGPGPAPVEVTPAGVPHKAEEPPAAVAPAPPQEYRVQNATDLTSVLEKAGRSAEVVLVKDIDLTPEEFSPQAGIPGLVVRGQERELTIRKDPKAERRPTLWFKYAAAREVNPAAVWTALTVDGGKVTLRGLRFVVDATQAPKIQMEAVKLRNGGRLDLEDCEFVQLNPPGYRLDDSSGAEQGARLTSVTVQGVGADGRAPVLTCNECFFVGRQEAEAPTGVAAVSGQEAVRLASPCRAQFTGCGFGPHGALFHLRHKGRQESQLLLRHCAALLVDGSAFRLDDDVACRLDVAHCIFSCPTNDAAGPSGSATLIQQTGFEDDPRFEGRDNCYHNLSCFWVRSTADEAVPVASTWEDLKALIKDNGDKSRVLGVSPWKAKAPLALLKGNQPALAFEVDVSRPELRERDENNKPKDQLVGLPFQGPLPPLPEVPVEAPVVKLIVDPGDRKGTAGVYRSLNEAIPAARPGDVILIRHTGLLTVDPVRLEKAATSLTLKPFPGHQPVLTLGETSDPSASLFRLHDGQLRLERLEFLLKPEQAEFKSQAVVTLSGAAQCTFKDCTITLDAGKAEDVPLSVIALADPKDVMKMGAAPGRDVPELRFERCFVRGKGDLVTVHASRALELKADNSLVVLAGSFLVIEGNPREPATTPAIQVALTHVTSYLGGHLMLLETGNDLKDLVRVQVSPTADCLFHSANGNSLIHFEGDVSDEQKMKGRVVWEGRHITYSNFDVMLDQQSKGEQMPLPPYGKDKWMDGGRFARVRFTAPPGDEQAFAKALPGDFQVKPDSDADPVGYGAEVDHLPRPALENRTGATPPADD